MFFDKVLLLISWVCSVTKLTAATLLKIKTVTRYFVNMKEREICLKFWKIWHVCSFQTAFLIKIFHFSSLSCFHGSWIWDKTGSTGLKGNKTLLPKNTSQSSLQNSPHTKLAPHSYHAKIAAVIIWITIWFLLLNDLCFNMGIQGILWMEWTKIVYK